MNGNVVEESRPRPQSAGIWTLFSWLRRSDRSSSESISSVGSDRTAISFDFLAPVQYKINSSPRILPSSPPTDTYKKRLHERNIRRLRDRDTSIHRKYGLSSVEDLGYDTLNTYSTFANKTNIYKKQECFRERRAASESIHRRAAYVPGKRRAPQPPLPVAAATLPSSYKRKRPAPKPPTLISANKENREHSQIFLMNNHSSNCTKHDKQTNVKLRVQKSDGITEQNQSKDKSFLKQIFVNRKRNSAIDTSHIKLLPISELDKQAHEIIERNRVLKAEDIKCGSQQLDYNVWICMKCLRRYNTSILTCAYCVPVDSSPTKYSKRITIDGSNMYTQTDTKVTSKCDKSKDEKEKLIEMLKEMKDSLPKRSKYEKKKHEHTIEKTPITETSTLRIGYDTPASCTSLEQPPTSSDSQQSSNIKNSQISKNLEVLNAKKKYLNSQHLSSTQSSLNEFKQILSQKQTSDINRVNISNAPVDLLKQSDDTFIAMNNQNQLKNYIASPSNTPVKQINEKDRDLNKTSDKKEICTDMSQTSSTILTAVPKQVPYEIKQETQMPCVSDSKYNISTSAQKLVKICDLSESKNQNKTAQIEQLHTEVNGNDSSNKIIRLQTPLKVSSLLNPLYSFKHNTNIQTNDIFKCEDRQQSSSQPLPVHPNIVPSSSVATVKGKQEFSLNPTTSTNKNINNSKIIENKNVQHLNPYTRRRALINQLEQSISNGDEKTAADVAAKLAKLRLSCSVLSFSSQIVTDTIGLITQGEKLLSQQPDFNEIEKIPVQENKNKAITIVQKDTSKPKSEKVLNETTKIKSKDLATSDVSQNMLKIEEPSSSKVSENDQGVSIEIWVEDKEAARGPINLQISRKATMRNLKQEVHISLGIAVHLQRWIIGNILCTNDSTPIATLAGTEFDEPFYLCLVESDIKKESISTIQKDETDIKTSEVYTELINLEKEALVPNSENFECEVCMEQRTAGEGAVLRECLHVFCRQCLADAVQHCEEPTASCLAVGCSGTLQDREIRALLSVEEYDKWLARGLAAAECGTKNTFHCQTADCNGWAFCEPGVRKFPCPVCKKTNCIPCQAVHDEESCTQYQEKLKKAVSGERSTDEGTQAFLNSLIARGEALECPECATVITKKWGCDWVKCSACKTEICWVTRGRRWGPRGRGDTSAGCRCGVDGARCHPSCSYCH